MRVLKLFFISVVFLFLVVMAVSLMIPSHVRISKAINLHASADSIFALIADTNEWRQWHPAFIPNDSVSKFPTVHITQRSQNDSEIVMHLQQRDKPEVINGWKLYPRPEVDSITLQWYMDFHLKWYPWEKFGSLFYENTYGAMMEKGLDNLKTVVQK